MDKLSLLFHEIKDMSFTDYECIITEDFIYYLSMKNDLLHSSMGKPSSIVFNKNMELQSVNWHTEGKIGRAEDLPSRIVCKEYDIEFIWAKEDMITREGDKPAIVIVDKKFRSFICQQWWINNVLHRGMDRPAVVSRKEDMKLLKWVRQGKIHRVTGPAVILKKGAVAKMKFIQDGKYAQFDGPNVIETICDRVITQIWFDSSGKTVRESDYPKAPGAILRYINGEIFKKCWYRSGNKLNISMSYDENGTEVSLIEDDNKIHYWLDESNVLTALEK